MKRFKVEKVPEILWFRSLGAARKPEKLQFEHSQEAIANYLAKKPEGKNRLIKTTDSNVAALSLMAMNKKKKKNVTGSKSTTLTKAAVERERDERRLMKERKNQKDWWKVEKTRGFTGVKVWGSGKELKRVDTPLSSSRSLIVATIDPHDLEYFDELIKGHYTYPDGIDHLRRTRIVVDQDGNPTGDMQVIISEKERFKAVKTIELEPSILSEIVVPSEAPETLEQLEELSAIWPCQYSPERMIKNEFITSMALENLMDIHAQTLNECGCLIVDGDRVLGSGSDKKFATDFSQRAVMRAIEDFHLSHHENAGRLDSTKGLYVLMQKEPCLASTMALMDLPIEAVIFGQPDWMHGALITKAEGSSWMSKFGKPFKVYQIVDKQ